MSMQGDGHSSQNHGYQPEATAAPAANGLVIADVNRKNGGAPRANVSEESTNLILRRIHDFNNILVRRAYKATVNSKHIELQSVLLSVEEAGVFFAREVFDELLAIALNYKDKNAISAIAQAAIRESVQSSDALRFQEIMFQLCEGRPETTEGRDNLMRACTPAALHSADAAILAALLRYKIVPTWDTAECNNFELVCATFAQGGPAPNIARPTVQGLTWMHKVCTKGTEDAPDRLGLLTWRFDTLLRACELHGGAPCQLATLYRGVGSAGQLAKMCVKL